MELLENKYCWNHKMDSMFSQIMLDEEVYAPEDRPEISRILFKKGEAYLEPAVQAGGSLRVKGHLDYLIWYVSGMEGRNSCMSGSVPFEEEMDLPEMAGKAELSVEVEDFAASLVHPRKVRLNGVLGLTARPEYREEPGICYEVRGIPGAQQKVKNSKGMMFLGEKTDTLRIRQNLEIPASAENLEELLFYNIALRSPDFMGMDGKVKVQGDLDIFAAYRSEDEREPVAWLNRMLPFQGEVTFPESRSGGVLQVVPRLIHREIAIAQDQDGENRILAVDVVLELTMKMMEEVAFPLLEDVYSPEMEVEVARERISIPHLAMKNQARMKLTDTVSLPGNERVMQICCSDGWVKMDTLERKPEGLLAEGVLFYWGIYLSAGGGEPFVSFSGAAPFSYMIDVGEKENAGRDCRCEVMPRVEQMSMSMIGNQEMECRASLLFDTMVWREQAEDVIREGKASPLPKEKLDNMPGIVGYIVQPQDSLWNIAKKYYTTEDLIRRKNGVTGEVKPGDRLVLLRSSGGMLK